jgi:hypothetical protein
MDIVITYVNGQDPVWQRDYEHYVTAPIEAKRFRDWGTLRYLMRGIEVNMPFIRKVHLVVSGESQVPEWINRDVVNVVLHKDIIPEECLPTFNSNPIEMHLHRIKGLDEEYLYFNDDIFPIGPCKAEEFFVDGKGIIGLSKHICAGNMFKKICRNSDHLARKALGLKPSWRFLRQQHICAPMLRSQCEEVYNKLRPEILASLTRVRSAENITQYLFTDYMYLKGRIINKRQEKSHISMGIATRGMVKRAITNPKRRLVCINDVQMSDSNFKKMQEVLISSLETRFPNKSKFEK